MCGGICGPTDNAPKDYYHSKKPIKQRKVPYKDYRGTVIASYRTARSSVELYKSKSSGEYVVTWHSALSSGAATYTDKTYATNEYNRKVPNND
jgi:hypothetical protein